MSAWLVSSRHIDAMIAAAIRRGRGDGGGLGWNHDGRRLEVTADNASEVGRMLWLENLASIEARYPDTKTGGELPGDVGVTRQTVEAYQVRPYRVDVSAVAMLKAVDCYEYQSCEHDGWDASSARAFCDALRSSLIGQLPGYEAAPWGIG